MASPTKIEAPSWGGGPQNKDCSLEDFWGCPQSKDYSLEVFGFPQNKDDFLRIFGRPLYFGKIAMLPFLGCTVCRVCARFPGFTASG